MCQIHSKNFCTGKTTNERYSKQKKRTASIVDTDDQTSLMTEGQPESVIAK
jgi:hypothetical protein